MEPILEIVKIGDDVLKTKCAPVKEIDSSLKMLTEAMLDELLEADGVGLAAPQIGIPQRFFVVDIRDGKKYVFINPEIVETSMETVDEAHLLLVLTIVRLQEYGTQGRRQREGVDG